MPLAPKASLAVALLLSNHVFARIADPSSFVNLFIGTIDGGHVFPGATIPHGMVKAGMDTDSPGNHAGYDGDAQYNVLGFSQLHDDGTGGNIPLSNFKLFPISDCPSFDQCQTTPWSRKVSRRRLANGLPDDIAHPGYFATNLSTSIRVELTSTRRTALHRYTFPNNSTTPRLLVDITDDGQSSGYDPELLVDPNTGRVTGGAEFSSSFGNGGYRAFTCVDFRGENYQLGSPTEYGIFQYDTVQQNVTTGTDVNSGPYGALLTFKQAAKENSTTILARVGVSFISSAQACANAESEIPNFAFESVRQASRKQWNELLGRIQVEEAGVDRDTISLFYSSLYRSHISPADYTGENPLWESTEPYFDSLYCNWDTYRTLYPLMSLHDPNTFSRVVRGMIDVQKHEGWLPECRGALTQQWVQGGSNADPILAELFSKYDVEKFGINKEDLYSALLADAEEQPPYWDVQGRQLNVWKQRGYLPQDLWESGGSGTRVVSKTLEYAFDDFVIGEVAKGLGKTDDMNKYRSRSMNFLQTWDRTITQVPGAPDSLQGMMQPRVNDGSFGYTEPRHCSPNDPTQSTCYLDGSNLDGFYEGSPIIYSQYVPHDTAQLIKLQGGETAFIERLDWIMEQNYFDPTNEPSQQIPFMYHYANRPGMSTRRARQVISQSFNTSRNGLPGNDDSGAMGSYVAFYLAGLYPLPGTRQILLSSPYFPSISFYNPHYDSTTTIISRGFKGNPKNGTGNVFVKSVKINGNAWHSNCFLDWNVFENGGVIELELTSDINVTCGSDGTALPPSLSTGGYE